MKRIMGKSMSYGYPTVNQTVVLVVVNIGVLWILNSCNDIVRTGDPVSSAPWIRVRTALQSLNGHQIASPH